MRQIREVLRLRHETGLSQRAIARACGLGTGPGVTLDLLWHEYRQARGEGGYGCSRFGEIYRRWARKLTPSERQVHRAGEKTFIDRASNPTWSIPKTGGLIPVELFVAAQGASAYTYAAQCAHRAG